MRGIRRASTPSGLRRADVERWQFRSRVAATPVSHSPVDERLSSVSTSSGVTPWLRKSYGKYNFGQKAEEPFAIATGLGAMPHRLERQSPMSYEITRRRFKHYGRQMQQGQQTRDMLATGSRSSSGAHLRPYSAISEGTRTEIRNLKHEIDQLRCEMRSQALAHAAGQTVAAGRKRTGLLYGGRAYSGDFCD